MDAVIAAQAADLLKRTGQSGDAAGIATLFAHLAKIEGFTDTIETTLGANTDAAATNASIWAMLKTLDSKPTSPIKSIQRGNASIAAVVSSVNVTISSVNMTKSMVIITSTSASSSAGDTCVTGELLNATTLSLKRGTTGNLDVDIKWQVIEFN